MSAVLSIVYPISYLIAFAGLVIVPSSNNEDRLISRIALAFFMLMAIDALFAGLLTIMRIPTNLVSSSVFHIVLGAACGYLINRQKGIQHFCHDAVDSCALLMLACVTLICGRAEFGPDLTIHWLASDAAVHLDRIRTIVETDSVRGMYVAWNFMAPWTEILSMYVSPVSAYKALIVGDLSILFFSGALFYALMLSIIPKADKKQRALFLAMALLYLLGYPLNSMIYGFFYLNVGVCMALCAIIYCTDLIQATNALRVIGMSLSLFGLINSYTLFAPTMYIVLFVTLVWNWHKNGGLFNWKPAVSIGLIFVMTGVLGIYFAYYGTFPSTSTVTASSAISWEGGIYRNLYSNQILFVPLALVAIWSRRNQLRRSPVILTFIATSITLLVVFLLTFNDIVSTYYFFKLYFLFSPLIFACATYGILYALAEGAREIIIASALTITAMGVVSISQIDQSLAKYLPEHDYGIRQSYHPALDIYSYNYSMLRSAPEFDPEALELYEEAERLTNETERPIGFLGNIEQYYWWTALVRQREERQNYPIEIRPWMTQTPQEAYKNISETCDYVLVLTREPYESVGSVESREVSTLLSSNDSMIIYANSAGYIIKQNQ